MKANIQIITMAACLALLAGIPGALIVHVAQAQSVPGCNHMMPWWDDCPAAQGQGSVSCEIYKNQEAKCKGFTEKYIHGGWFVKTPNENTYTYSTGTALCLGFYKCEWHGTIGELGTCVASESFDPEQSKTASTYWGDDCDVENNKK